VVISSAQPDRPLRDRSFCHADVRPPSHLGLERKTGCGPPAIPGAAQTPSRSGNRSGRSNSFVLFRVCDSDSPRCRRLEGVAVLAGFAATPDNGGMVHGFEDTVAFRLWPPVAIGAPCWSAGWSRCCGVTRSTSAGGGFRLAGRGCCFSSGGTADRCGCSAGTIPGCGRGRRRTRLSRRGRTASPETR
jgi:hypothetical protein